MARPRIAAVVTEYRRYSHAQHILDRFLFGYGWDSRHHKPRMDVVSLYVDQTGDGHLSEERAKLFPSMKIYPTIAEALTQGGKELAVDGVLLIAEHGDYPMNEKQQKLYPRYEFFMEIVDVFRQSGRAVPVFNDKHLSWNWDWAKEMVETARELDFAFLAGSSLPVTPRIPPVDIPMGAEIEEVIGIGLGGPDGYCIHALEAMQCMVERRRGGETGVVSMHALKEEAVWNMLEQKTWDEGGCDADLLEACLCRSFTLAQTLEGYNHSFPDMEKIRSRVDSAFAYRFEYADGLKATMLLLEGLVGDFTFAARLKGQKEPFSLQFYLPPREVCNFFSALVNPIEELFLTGKAPYPVERTLLTTGLTAAGVESLWQGQKPMDTPHLDVHYQPSPQSTFWRS